MNWREADADPLEVINNDGCDGKEHEIDTQPEA
jgi:hypothetical protein